MPCWPGRGAPRERVMLTQSVYCHSPLGCLRVTAKGGALSGVEFVDFADPTESAGTETRIDREAEVAPAGELSVLDTACRQLGEYFLGTRRTFDLSLCPQGTAFQRQVWSALQAIPFGKTLSYKDLARIVGRPAATRAVGMANHRNPLAIIIPCHRVIGANGALTGYAAGLEVKRWLLAHEGWLPPSAFSYLQAEKTPLRGRGRGAGKMNAII